MKDSDLHRRLIGFLEGKTSSGDWDKINKLAENEEFVTVLRQMDKLTESLADPIKDVCGRKFTDMCAFPGGGILSGSGSVWPLFYCLPL